MAMGTAEIIQTLKSYARFPSRLHGPAHWARVHRFGDLLASHEDLPAEARACVEVFAWLHDLAREDDNAGNQHAIDGAAQLDEVLPAISSPLSPAQIETIRVAIRHHSDGMIAQQASDLGLFEHIGWPRALVITTVGCCWDADRLDLPRVGISPSADLMSTSSWREVQPLSTRIHEAIAMTIGETATAYNPQRWSHQRKRMDEQRTKGGDPGPVMIEISPPPRPRPRKD